jgi:hypothetical protein
MGVKPNGSGILLGMAMLMEACVIFATLLCGALFVAKLFEIAYLYATLANEYAPLEFPLAVTATAIGLAFDHLT